MSEIAVDEPIDSVIFPYTDICTNKWSEKANQSFKHFLETED